MSVEPDTGVAIALMRNGFSADFTAIAGLDDIVARAYPPPANPRGRNRDDHAPHRARHPIQRSRSTAHQLGGHARGDQAGPDLLDLDRPRRRPAACHSARRRLARRRTALLHGPGRAEGAQPRQQPARRADHGCQRLAERPRRGCRGRGGPRHRRTAAPPARRSLGTKVGRAMAIRGHSGWLSTRRRDRPRNHPK
jgi:hypothetical protein